MNKYLAFRIRSYVSHWMRAKGAYHIHSPFVYNWYQRVLKGPLTDKGEEIEQLRKRLSQKEMILEFEDLGAGTSGPSTRQLGQLVKRASRRRTSGELLARMVQYYQPKRGLELGTHVGISALYCLSSASFDEFVTLEGIKGLAEIAQQNFHTFGVHASLFQGSFDELLEDQIDLSDLSPDFVFIDGNHQYEPTLSYFRQILPHVPDGGIMIFDDIHWSPGMAGAWKEIMSHPEISISIDLYYLGICFVRRKQAKEHFFVRF